MTKQIDAFLDDALKHEKVQSLFGRLLAKLFELLTPYLVGIAIFGGLVLVGIGAILYLLLRKGGGGGV
jgi:prolipoprotein diacylglyceryltransferase